MIAVVVLLSAFGAQPAVAATAKVTVSPKTATIEVATSKQFSAAVSFSPTTVTWEVNGIKGGNASVGTISASGLYVSPAVVPSANKVTITARSTSSATVVGTATLTITRPVPVLSSVTPTPITVGAFAETLTGSKFASDSKVLVNGIAVKTTFISATQLKAESTAAAVGTLAFSVSQPGPGAVTSNTLNATVVSSTTSVTVSLSPTAVALPIGGSQAFTASLTGTTNASLTWSVNGIAGGSSTVGTVNAAGVYIAPTVMPSPATITVQAASVASPTSVGKATVTLQAPVKVSVTPTAASVAPGATQSFVASVTGSTNTAVTWQVNGVAGGSASVGTISAAGLYTAPSSIPSPSTVSVRAVAAADTSAAAQAAVTVTQSTTSSSSLLSAARFLEQSSFGPTPASLARVQQIGITAYLDEQLNMAPTPIPDFGDDLNALKEWMLYDYTKSPDQLRQRVAYALSQVIVVSGQKLPYAGEMRPWLVILNNQAFGNYRDVLRQVSVSPSMGKYLDLANSMKAGLAGGANENYPRELMQLFTIGLVKLNQDGSVVVGADGQPVPTYTQDTVREVARALTGWTYATAPGNTPSDENWEYFGASLEPRAKNHDAGAKSFLGCSLPAGQSVDQDLDGVIDCLMAHPNMPPFIATRLIRSLVMSNPSPAYIKRVADVFAGTTTGVRGDLRATVRAVLLDPEARLDSATPSSGRLKEPVLHVAGLLRALNGGFDRNSGLTYLFDTMGQSILSPTTVFSWFSPLFKAPGTTLFGPEFQIYSPSESLLKGNLIYALLSGSMGTSGYSLDLSPFKP
ncbi:MAG: DUF1800 family protein [Vicinamibacterales bacterium]